MLVPDPVHSVHSCGHALVTDLGTVVAGIRFQVMIVFEQKSPEWRHIVGPQPLPS